MSFLRKIKLQFEKFFNSGREKQTLGKTSINNSNKKKTVKTVNEWMSENDVVDGGEKKEEVKKEVKKIGSNIDDEMILEELKRLKNIKQKNIIENKQKDSIDKKETVELGKVTGFLANAKTSFTEKEFLERKIEVLGFLKDLKEKKKSE